MKSRYLSPIAWLCAAGLVCSTLAQPADPPPAPEDPQPVILELPGGQPVPLPPGDVDGITITVANDDVVVTEDVRGIEVVGQVEIADPPPTPDSPAGGDPAAPSPSRPDPRTRNNPPSRPPGDRSQPQRTRARVGPSPETSVALPEDIDNPPGDANLRLNFRGVPLEMVLDYLSDAAGFIIVLETEVKGKIDVWSNQPLDRNEAVDLLNTVLGKNGYTALRNGRTLTIVSRDDAKRRDVPVRSGSDPVGIPKSDEIVTQIIPVRFINAVQLTRDLQPLIPSTATVASNEGGNAIMVTDTQTNIRRLAQIIRALDTSVSSVSAVKVFALRFADAKALVTVIRDLFQSTDTSRGGGNNNNQQVFRGGGGGGGGFPGFPGFGGGDAGGGGRGGGGGAGQGGGGASGSSRVSAPRVVAVADERSNSLVVSAPVEQMALVEELVNQVDTNVEDVTELRVFRLKNADPQEMAEVLADLFPDPTTSNQNNRGGQLRFGGGQGGGPFGGFGGGRQGATDTSARSQKQSKVTAVPDPRTGSIVVSAARELMGQISQMIEQLDANPAKKQKVFVYSVENSDPQAVEEILRGLFEGQNSRNRGSSARSTTRQTGNQLNNRATQNQNQGGNRNSGFGNAPTGGGQAGR